MTEINDKCDKCDKYLKSNLVVMRELVKYANELTDVKKQRDELRMEVKRLQANSQPTTLSEVDTAALTEELESKNREIETLTKDLKHITDIKDEYKLRAAEYRKERDDIRTESIKQSKAYERASEQLRVYGECNDSVRNDFNALIKKYHELEKSVKPLETDELLIKVKDGKATIIRST